MSVRVRVAEKNDINTLVTLITALADYEELPPPTSEAVERLASDGWGANPRFSAWLGEVEEPNGTFRAVGYAITFFTYSTFLCKPTLYLEDIFVLPDFRGKGVGSLMFSRLEAEAVAQGCGRMEWVVLDWNVSAQEFYQRRGAEFLKEWQVYRITFDKGTA